MNYYKGSCIGLRIYAADLGVFLWLLLLACYKKINHFTSFFCFFFLFFLLLSLFQSFFLFKGVFHSVLFSLYLIKILFYGSAQTFFLLEIGHIRKEW